MFMGRLVLFFILAFTPGFVTAETQPPIDHFFKDRAVYGAKISPDGEHILIAASKLIHVFSTVKMKVIKSFKTNAHQDYVYDFWWLSNERFLFETALKYAHSEVLERTGEMHALNIDGSKKGRLFRQAVNGLVRHQIRSFLPDQDGKILVEYKHSLQRIRDPLNLAFLRPSLHFIDTEKVRSGRIRWGKTVRSPISNGHLFADHAGVARLAIGFRKANLKVLHRKNADQDWHPVPIEGFQLDPLNASVLMFNKTNDRIFLLERLTGDTRALSSFDPETGTLRVLYRNSKFDLSSESLIYNLDRTDFVGVQVQGDYPEIHFFNANDPVAVVYRSLKPTFPDHSIQVTSMSDDASKALVFVISDRDPGRLIYVDMKNSKQRTIDKLLPDILVDDMVERQHFSYTTDDGLTIRGYLSMPQDDGPHPFVVIPHGGPHSVRDNWLFDRESQFLVSRGYATVQINYRGSGGYGRAFEEAGVGQWGNLMVGDLLFVTDQLTDQYPLDEHRACIYGASYGAFASISAVTRQESKFKCAAAFAGIYDLEIIRKTADTLRNWGGKQYLDTALGRDKKVLFNQSPVNFVDKITVPVLLAHGEKDFRTPRAYAKRLRKAFDKHNVRYQWVEERAEAHGSSDETRRVNFYRELLAFLDENIGYPQTPPIKPTTVSPN